MTECYQVLPRIQLELRLNLVQVGEEDGQREAVHQTRRKLLTVYTNVADNVETSAKYSIPLQTKIIFVRLICQQ